MDKSTDINWTTENILSATKGDLLQGGDINTFSGISIDSRKISPDDIFVAVKGENFDGHHFVGDVLKKGVKCVIISKENNNKNIIDKNPNMNIIGVDNTITALGHLANFRRRAAHATVIAITGSNGKTTTKEMTAAIISKKYKTLSTVGNLNNEIGLPLTLFNIDKSHQFAVLELGMNHFGEISRLAEICSPEIGLVTNVGSAHIEGLGSIEGVAKAKGELIKKIDKNGTVILNLDDERVAGMADKTSAKVLFYGLSEKASVRGEFISEDKNEILFKIFMPDGNQTTIKLKAAGTFMISNALAAASAGYTAGLNMDEIKKGLEEFSPVPGRMNIHSTKKGIHIIDDSYNANPNSVKEAIQTLKALKKGHKGVVVIGDMFELGSSATRLHEEIGALSANSELKNLYVTGEYAEFVKKGAVSAGMDRQAVFTGTKKEITERLTEKTEPGDWILVKGSRTMKMEEIVSHIKDWGNR